MRAVRIMMKRRARRLARRLKDGLRLRKTAGGVIARVVGIAALIAFGVYTLFYLARDIGFFEDVINAEFDRSMYVHAETDSAIPPPTLIDFDARTMAELRDPIAVPPRDLATVLERLSLFNLRAVFVDLDLSYLGDGADFHRLSRALRGLADAGVPILLAREVLFDSPEERIGRLRTTPLDALVSNHPNMIWVSTLLPRSNDGFVRHVAIVEPVLRDGRAVVLPSPALVLLTHARHDSFAAAKRSLEAALRRLPPHAAASRSGMLTIGARGGNLTLDLRNNSRIDYRLRWKDTTQLTSLPARPFIGGRGPFDPTLFTDRIVMIGSTANLHDLAQTPLEGMPGAWIHANVIYAWLVSGPDPGLSFWQGALVVVLVTVLAALAAASLVLRLPVRWRPAAREVLPLAIPLLFSLAFLLWDMPSISSGLFIVSYVIMRVILFVEKRLEPYIGRRTG